MANPSKDQGTKFETAIVRYLQSEGFRARRIAEGGAHDIGDVMLDDFNMVVEAKDRSALNVHETLIKANRKADPRRAVVWWKRKERKKGNSRRTEVGKPVVVMSEELFVEMLGHMPSVLGLGHTDD